MRDPQAFGKYVLLERISVGGMAEVFKAKAFGIEGFEKLVAIKRILPTLAEDGDFIDMFIDEAKICGQLNHVNICQIFELGRVGDSHFIAMEYVWGKDLLQIQNRNRKLRTTMKPVMAAWVGAKMCEGLDYAHRKKDAAGKPLNIIHRDISPQNILISYEGEAKIIDFGIAKAATRSSRTQAGVLKGKFGYMSPEQVRGLPLDRRSDVFAIGTILYELLIADRLFVGETDFETLERVRNVDVPALGKRNPTVPPELVRIISKALSKDVDDRYQWASEMQADLVGFLATPTIDPPWSAELSSRWMREFFAVEMKREQEVLDQQRRVGREVLAQTTPGSMKAPPSKSTLVPGAVSAPLLTPLLTTAEMSAPLDELPGEQTTITESSPVSGELPAQPTAILNSSMPAPPKKGESPIAALIAEGIKAEPTMVFGDGVRSQSQIGVPIGKLAPEQSTLMREAPANLPPIRLDSHAPLSPLIQPFPLPASELSRTPPSLPAVPSSPAMGQMVAAPPPQPPRPPLWRDLVLGVGVAAAVVGGVLGARAYFSRAPATGTLVVMPAGRAGEVVVDGVVRGQLHGNQPLKLKGMTAGDHRLIVRAASGTPAFTPLAQTVNVVPGDVSVVSATPSDATEPAVAVAVAEPSHAHPAAGAPITTGTLILSAPSARGVYVDGAELPDGAWRRPIPLRAEVTHQIRVVSADSREAHLDVLLHSGQELTRSALFSAPAAPVTPNAGTPAVAATGKGILHVTTDPPGADVAVNGKRAGVSPIDVTNIDTSSSARLTVRRKGFQSIVKYVSFDKAAEQSLDLKLASSSGGGGDASMPKLIPTLDSDTPPLDQATKISTTAENGFLVANTQPWARVFIDGKDTGKTTPIAPRSKLEVKPGKHTVTFVVSGKKFNYDVVVRPNEDTRLIKQLVDSN